MYVLYFSLEKVGFAFHECHEFHGIQLWEKGNDYVYNIIL